MQGEVTKKTKKARGSDIKMSPKTSVKPPVSLAKQNPVTKKRVTRQAKKVILSVRAINTRPAKVVEQEIKREEEANKKTIKKVRTSVSDEEVSQKKSTTLKQEKKNNQSNEPKQSDEKQASGGRLLTLKTEKEKRIVMWIGVIFFMTLIAIYWVLSTAHGIKQASSEWKQSEKAANWKQMTEEITLQLDEMKNNIETVRNYGSSSDEQVPKSNLEPLSARDKKSSSSETINTEVLESLKHKLEIKSGISEPLKEDYFFVMSEDSKKELLKKVDTLKIGDNINKVRGLLSEPDSSEEILDRRGNFISNILIYNIRIYDKQKINEKYDQYVGLEFSKSGELEKINKVID